MSNSNFSWKDGLMIVLAVLTFGLGWLANNQSTVIAYVAVLIVWLLAFLGKQFPRLSWIKGKTFLTVLVFIASFILALLFQPFKLPALPTWSGDIVVFAPALAIWLTALFAGFSGAVTMALGIYNILLAQVLDKVSTTLKTFFLPKSPAAAVQTRIPKR